MAEVLKLFLLSFCYLFEKLVEPEGYRITRADFCARPWVGAGPGGGGIGLRAQEGINTQGGAKSPVPGVRNGGWTKVPAEENSAPKSRWPKVCQMTEVTKKLITQRLCFFVPFCLLSLTKLPFVLF